MLHEKLGCYSESISMAEELCTWAAKWPRGYGYLADQVRRAMASVVLQIAEGNTRKSQAERRRFFEIARGSAAEVAACVDLMLAFGLIGRALAESWKSRLNAISRMLWGLMR